MKSLDHPPPQIYDLTNGHLSKKKFEMRVIFFVPKSPRLETVLDIAQLLNDKHIHFRGPQSFVLFIINFEQWYEKIFENTLVAQNSQKIRKTPKFSWENQQELKIQN